MPYVTVSADVEVDLDDVFEAASEDELRAALKRKVGSVSAAIFGGFFAHEQKVKSSIWQAIVDGEYETVADLVAPYVDPGSSDREGRYARLKRDPNSGRPVIQ